MRKMNCSLRLLMNAPWISNTCPHWWPFRRHKSVYFPFVLYTKFSLDNFSAGAASSTGPAANCRSAAAWGRCCPGAVKCPAATTGLATITILSFTFISFHLFSFSLPFIREDWFLFHSFLRLESKKKWYGNHTWTSTEHQCYEHPSAFRPDCPWTRCQLSADPLCWFEGVRV